MDACCYYFSLLYCLKKISNEIVWLKFDLNLFPAFDLCSIWLFTVLFFFELRIRTRIRIILNNSRFFPLILKSYLLVLFNLV